MKTKTTRTSLNRLGKNKKAVSPAISTTILTSAIIVMLLVVTNFANTYLNNTLAESEFNAMKQFMQAIGLQIDNVAWINGKIETTQFATRFGYVSFQPIYLNYSVYLNGSPSANFSYVTRILLYNMPIDHYNIADGHYERLIPFLTDSFLQTGASAPVSRVFVIEKLSASNGSYLRIVVSPCIRMINATISTGSSAQTNYTKLYLPILSPGSQATVSRAVTLSGSQPSRQTGTANTMRINVTFPNATIGFDANFFKFSSQSETASIQPGSLIEFYTTEVDVSIGLTS